MMPSDRTLLKNGLKLNAFVKSRRMNTYDLFAKFQLLSDAFAYASIDETGGRVSLPSSAVSITVPEGALDRREDVFVAVSRNPSDRPFLSSENIGFLKRIGK